MGSKILEVKSETKFLGIVLDSNLTFRSPLQSLTKKLKVSNLMLRSLRPYLDNANMINLYYTFVYPHLIYGIEFWGHASKTNLKPIEALQKAALRILTNVKPGQHVSTFFKKLKIMPVGMLFEYRILKLFLKSFNSEELDQFRPQHKYPTKTKHLLMPKHTNNQRGDRSLLCSGIKLYNRYLLDGWTWSQPGCLGGLAGRLWGFSGQ